MLRNDRAAPEVLDKSQYSHASDVWSYGIVCWEVFTYGSNPYKWLSNQEVTEQVATGLRLTKPELCPDLLWELVQVCWDEIPANRPTFMQLCKSLKEMIPKLLNRSGDEQPETQQDTVQVSYSTVTPSGTDKVYYANNAE